MLSEGRLERVARLRVRVRVRVRARVRVRVRVRARLERVARLGLLLRARLHRDGLGPQRARVAALLQRLGHERRGRLVVARAPLDAHLVRVRVRVRLGSGLGLGLGLG